MKRLGAQTVAIESDVSIAASAAIAGVKEGEGPLSRYFDTIIEDSEWGEESWEKTESKMQREAVFAALKNGNFSESQLHYIFAGDLLNQCIGSTFGLREIAVSFFGLFGACSTMAESLSLAAMLTDGGACDLCAAVTSSHFCTAERQFRMPLEYGGQRTPTSQWTVTGAGAAIVQKGGGGPYIRHVTTGKIVDMGIKDVNNMGSAMAPAAVDTMTAHFRDTGRTPEFYDLIVTGDLGSVGRAITIEMMEKNSYTLDKYDDCGCMIFDLETQDVSAGGSGCGCSAATLCGYILRSMGVSQSNAAEQTAPVFNNVLFVATGALMSPTSMLQGESIPAIAHAVAISRE